MPIYYFVCEKCGEFEDLVFSPETKKVKCPKCGEMAKKKANAVYRVSGIVSDNPKDTVMSPKEIDVRIGRQAETLRQKYDELKQKRSQAQKKLGTMQVVADPEKGYVPMKKEDVEYRKKVENIIKKEPESDLKKDGFRVIKKKETK